MAVETHLVDGVEPLDRRGARTAQRRVHAHVRHPVRVGAPGATCAPSAVGTMAPVETQTPVVRTVDQGIARLLPDIDRKRAWLLTVDGSPQSYVDLDAPTHLEFEYVRRMAHLLDLLAAPGTPLDLLHLGGGGLTLPRYAAATRPGSRQWVVEVDGALTALVSQVLPLPADQDVTVVTGDARRALETAPAASADVVVADVYGGRRVPAHLTTLEYLRAAARVLRPGGLYLANIADGAPFTFLRAQLATLERCFPARCLIAEPAVLRGRRFGNAVLAGSRYPLPLTELARRTASDAFPARVVHGQALASFVAGAAPARDASASPSPEPPEGAFRLR